MNNLLRALTASQVNLSVPESDLRLLLSTVKETHRSNHELASSKASDAFYESLEGLLLDLRTVTIDNHDAEAFLKPVSRTEVPDYYDVIQNPMDLQTMLKKVKQKQYKSKREFKDDLDLIWSNCFSYNATENHPLRQCAKRLKAKAEALLKSITDYKERLDPPIPAELPIRTVAPRLNGASVNGHGRPRTPSTVQSPGPSMPHVAIPSLSGKPRKDLPFPESPAIIRTPEGMVNFLRLDQQVDSLVPSADADLLEERLSQLAGDADDDSSVDSEVGAKRKLNGFSADHSRPRKRPRTQQSPQKDPVELWWDAVQSDDLLANGLPGIPCASSSASDTPSPPITDIPRNTTSPRKKKKKKKPQQKTNTLLYHINNNIRTMRRVRTTHAKFAVLNQSNEEGGGLSAQQPADTALDEIVEEEVDERPWKPNGAGLEIGEKNADDCLHWMGTKVLEHVGFQGTSKVALDVLSSVTAEYLMNVGRTIRFLSDKYAQKMSAEEIILHTLFESGVTRIYELERYIKDDVLRYGGRLAELEKKLANAYREATTEEAWDDDALFRTDGEEEEEGEFVTGNFADSFGEDFLGLRELGIAAEFGLTSLTIPKKLLKGKGKGGLKEGPSASKPSEPPPPFPPPPPFIPLDSKSVDDQIGLLKSFYQQRISVLAASLPNHASSHHPPAYPAPDTQSLGDPSQPQPHVPNGTASPPPIVLPDDAPSPAHTKIGPLGQIMKTASTAAAAKKKAKAKAPVPPPMMNGASSNGPMFDSFPGPGTKAASKGPPSPSKGKKANSSLPPVVMASA